MKDRIKIIIKKIESGKRINELDIEEILNNIDFVSIYGFTNSIGYLTNYGKNELINYNKELIIEQLSEWCVKK